MRLLQKGITPRKSSVNGVLKDRLGEKNVLEQLKNAGLVKWAMKVEERFWRRFVPVRVPIYFEYFLKAREEGLKFSKERGMPDVPPNGRLTQSSTQNDAWLDEISVQDPWVYLIQLNEETGKKKGLKTGDWIWIENIRGKRIKAPARLVQGVHPEHVSIADCHGFAKCHRVEAGQFTIALRQMLSALCMQSSEPERLTVCPTGATQQTEEGIVTVDANLCMECKYCMMACPYGQRHIISQWLTYFPDSQSSAGKLVPYEAYVKSQLKSQWEQKRGTGVAAKCDFCICRVREGRQPACVKACPARARTFGDLNDPNSEVSKLIRTEPGFQLNPEFGTDPSVYYLPPR